MTQGRDQRDLPTFGKPVGPCEPVTHIQSKPFVPALASVYIQQLEQHGCTVEASGEIWTITFPAGTTRQEIFPRAMEMRCEISLPDGYQLFEVIKRTDLTALFFPTETLPDAFLQEHQELLKSLRGEA